MTQSNPWIEVFEFIFNEALRGFQEIYDQWNVKLEQWLDDILTGPVPDDWRTRLDRFVRETEEMGLEILPESIRVLEDLIESRVVGTAEPAHLGQAERAAGPVAERPPYVASLMPDVSGPPKPKGAGAGPSKPSKPAEDAGTGSATPATKEHVPADRRGVWIEGTKGDGVFQYADTPENREARLANKKVRFEGGYIGLGGLPPEAYYGGSAEAASIEISNVTATSADNTAADKAMRKKLNNPNWKRPPGYIWNHAGGPGSKVMELVDRGLHEAIAHKGPGAPIRAAGRAMAVIDIYLTLRDALQAAGIVQPDYFEYAHAEYYFVADDGSVFTVQEGWLRGGTRVFIAGPRKGQTESISGEDVQKHLHDAEEQWGHYVPGALFREPRFIPGKERSTLPFIKYKDGIPYEAGWIDETGVHLNPIVDPSERLWT